MSIIGALRWAQRVIFVLLVFSVPWVTGCATITRGTTEAFVVETDPPGAKVELSNGLRCRTPCSLEMKRKEGFVVKIMRDGYEPVEATVSTQVAGAGAAGMAGNVLLGGLIGAAVDAGTGAMNELKPNPLHVTLVKLYEDIAPATRPSGGSFGTTQRAAPAPAWTATEPQQEPLSFQAAVPANPPSAAGTSSSLVQPQPTFGGQPTAGRHAPSGASPARVSAPSMRQDVCSLASIVCVASGSGRSRKP